MKPLLEDKRFEVLAAGPIDRRVAATTAKLLGDIHPLAIHRRNYLVLTLILPGKLEEARQIPAANWRLNAPPHANTTPRLAILRHLIALLEAQPNTDFPGQFKTLLTGPRLPVGDGVAVPWDIACFIGCLNAPLGALRRAQGLELIETGSNGESRRALADAIALRARPGQSHQRWFSGIRRSAGVHFAPMQ